MALVALPDGPRSVIRAAFDVGSGSFKVQVAAITAPVPGSALSAHAAAPTIRTLYALEEPVFFGLDWLRSPDGNLSADVQTRGLAVLRRMLATAATHGATQHAAIFTEVFRKAHNGAAFVAEVAALLREATAASQPQHGNHQSTRSPVTLISQDEEGELGFATALATVAEQACNAASASAHSESDDACVWDSGGASFQICSRVKDGTDATSAHSDSVAPLCKYLGCLGSGVAASVLANLDAAPSAAAASSSASALAPAAHSSPNPVSAATAVRLIEALGERLSSPVPSWLSAPRASPVIALTGTNDIFTVCCQVLTQMRDESDAGSGACAHALCPSLFAPTNKNTHSVLDTPCNLSSHFSGMAVSVHFACN